MSDDGFSDSPFVHNARPAAQRQPKPGELVDEFYCERNQTFYRVELRDHGKWSVEAQILDPVDLVIGQRFTNVEAGGRTTPAQEFAIAWAKNWRAHIEKGGA